MTNPHASGNQQPDEPTDPGAQDALDVNETSDERQDSAQHDASDDHTTIDASSGDESLGADEPLDGNEPELEFLFGEASNEAFDEASAQFDATNAEVPQIHNSFGGGFSAREVPEGYTPQPVNIPLPVSMMTVAKVLSLQGIEYFPMVYTPNEQDLSYISNFDDAGAASSYVALRTHQPCLDITMRIEQETARYLEIEATMSGRVTMHHIPSLARAITGWNRERVSPTARMFIHPDGQASAVLNSTYLVDKPASIEQLTDFIQLTFGAMNLAVVYFHEEITNFTAQTVPPIDASETWMDSETLETGKQPKPLSYPLVQQALKNVGILKMQALDDGLLCIINGITFGIFLEHGPSLLVKGYWSPSLDPVRDFMPVFIACDTVNADNPTVKAFIEHDDARVQVRVEYIAHAGGGLNQEQLERNLSMALHDILRAIHTISTQVSGATAVEWPDQ